MEINWLIAGPIIAGVVGILIGYFIGYASKKAPNHKNEIEAWENKYNAKCRDLDSSLERRRILDDKVSHLQTQLSNVESELASSQSKLNAVQNIAGGATSTTTTNTNETRYYDADHVRTVYGKPVVENDLTIIDGIDVEIASLLKDRGIDTWRELGNTSAERCREIVLDSGRSPEVHQPSTWPEQARMARENKWTELKNWQESHYHVH